MSRAHHITLSAVGDRLTVTEQRGLRIVTLDVTPREQLREIWDLDAAVDRYLVLRGDQLAQGEQS